MDPEYDQDTTPKTDNTVFTWIFVSLITCLVVADLSMTNAELGLASLLFLPSWVGLTIIHEGAHALAARQLGWQVPTLDVGFGKIWRQFQVGRTEVSLRQYPLMGCVRIIPTHFRQPRLRNALIYAAGPLSEGAVVVALVSLFGIDRVLHPTNFMEASIAVICLAGAIGVVINLFPYRSESGVVTDGLGILTSASLPMRHFEALYCEPIVQAQVDRRIAGKLEETLDRLSQLAERFPHVVLIHYEIACTLVLLNRRSDALFGFQAFLSSLNSDDRSAAATYLIRLRVFPNLIEEPFSWHEH